MQSIAFLDVNVIPMDRERPLESQTVIVRDGRIVAIGPTAEVPVPPDVESIPCEGRYLIPGLTDAHTHIAFGGAPMRWMLDLFLVNGVTIVLNLSGTPEVVALREAVNRGEVLAPTLFTSGPILDGDPPIHTVSVPLRTAEEAERAVADQDRIGYDMVKSYSNLTAEPYRAILAAARRHRLPVIGHVPRPLGMMEPLRWGQTIAHMEEFVYSPDLFNMQCDASKIPMVTEMTRAAGVWVVPTMTCYHTIVREVQDLEGMLARPETAYVPAELLEAMWRRPSNRYVNQPHLETWSATLQPRYELQQKLLQAFHQAGVPVLAGTDAPIPVVVPGFSLHDELQELVEAGLSPYAALKAATSDAARFFGVLDDCGTVETGKRADLVLLDSNPLERIANTRRIGGVMLRGRWLPKVELDGILATLAASAAGSQPA